MHRAHKERVSHPRRRFFPILHFITRRSTERITPLARVFGSLASAILDLGLPAIRSWLRNRVGPGAEVESVRADGALVHLTGVVLPLGRAGRVTLDRAAVAIVRGREERRDGQRVRLDSFRGALVLDAAPSGELRAEVTFAADAQPAPDSWACGRLVLDHVSWAPLTARDPRAALRGEAHLTITSDAWSLDGGALEGAATRAKLSGHGELESGGEQEVELQLADVDAEMLAALVSALGLGDAPFHIPVRTHARGGARLKMRGSSLDVTGSLELATEHSQITADPIRFDGRAWDGTVLRGTLTADDARIIGLFPGPVLPAHGTSISGELTLSGSTRELGVAGTLGSDHVRLVRGEPEGEQTALDMRRVSARVRLDRDGLVYRDLQFHAYAGLFRGRGTIPFGDGESDSPRLHLDVDDASTELATALNAFFGGPRWLRVAHGGERGAGEVWLPADGRLSGSFTLDAQGGLTVRARLERDGTDLTARYVTRGGGAGHVRGHATLRDIARATPGELPFSYREDDAITVDVAIFREEERMAVGGSVTSERLHVSFGGGPLLELVRASGEVYADDRGVVWRNANARLHGGWLSALGLSGDLGTWVVVEATGVDVSEVRWTGGVELSRWVRGRLHAEMRLARAATEGQVHGRGKVRLTDAAYPALGELEPLLARYGLPVPNPASAGEATASVVLGRSRVSFLDAIVRTADATVAGALSLDFSAHLQGRFDVRVADSYLRRSKLLVLPSVLAEQIRIPVTLSGPAGALRVDADLMRAFGRFVEKNKLTEMFDEAVDDVMSLVTGARRPTPTPDEVPVATPDDGAAGAAPARADVESMVASRVDWDGIAARVRRWRGDETPDD